MNNPSDKRTIQQPLFHRAALLATALFVELAGFAAAAPVDPSELVAPKIEISGGVVKITVEPSVKGRIYQLQVSENLTVSNWQNLESEAKGDGNDLTITTAHIPGIEKRFFRLLLSDGFSLVPAGAFTMGRTSGDTEADAPPVTVILSAFYIGNYEVTKAEWNEVRSWALENGYIELAEGSGKAEDHPVHSVNWFDVLKWCNAKSEMDGLTPVYMLGTAVMRTGTETPTPDWSANGYRLPTEAEWEKTSRGGVAGKRYPSGSDTISHADANYSGLNSAFGNLSAGVGYHPSYVADAIPYTAPVGSFAKNGYGSYDMAGNVFEWCWDWYGTTTYVNGAINPRGVISGSSRVFRGGCWFLSANRCRASDRHFIAPEETNNGIGFRMARTSAP